MAASRIPTAHQFKALERYVWLRAQPETADPNHDKAWRSYLRRRWLKAQARTHPPRSLKQLKADIYGASGK